MPGYRGHICGGIATYALIFFILSGLKLSSNYIELVIWLGLCIAGSLFPDIDVKSKGQKLFYTAFLLVIIFAISKENWHLLSLASLIGVIPIISRHRGMSHRAWFVVLVPMTIPIAIQNYSQSTLIGYLFFVSGALSHLILDFGLVRFLRRTFPRRNRFPRRRHFR